MVIYSHAQYGSITVSYTQELDGGGNTFGRTYVPFVEEHFGKVGNLFEWCAGPGFIGFSLLAAGCCDVLHLGDVNPSAQAAVERTVRENDLADRVRFHLSAGFAAVPMDSRWDLMVGNPPHVNTAAPTSVYQHTHSPLMWQDADWAVHRDFYAGAPRFLRPGGSIVILENRRFSSPADFTAMITQSGLELVGSFDCGGQYEDYYFVWSKRPGPES